MNAPAASVHHFDCQTTPPQGSGFFKRAVLRRLAALDHGQLILIDGEHSLAVGSTTGTSPAITLRVHDVRFWREIALGGAVGAGEAYTLGWWSTDDLVGVIRILCRNRRVLADIEGGLATLRKPLLRFAHWLNHNSRSGAARNISAHYDLSNEFFAHMLDPTMAYSSAYFAHPQMSLLQAQITKFDRICKKLQLTADDHILEIGTGWGGFAIHTARNYGCRVTTTTISREQYDLAQQRIRHAGLEQQITLLLCDYRDLSGKFSALVSIEMIEAIGHQQYRDFFRTCMDRLLPGGKALIQSITIQDDQYERAKNDVDFIKRYIFPGCCIPSLRALDHAMTSASDLQQVDCEDITEHYVRTLALWRQRFEAQWQHIRAIDGQRFNEQFRRLWQFYLCYCEGGFAERAIGDVQLLLTRPQVN